MVAQIELKKLSGIQVNDKKVVTSVKDAQKETELVAGISGLNAKDQKIVFAGQDYKGTFTAGDDFATRYMGKLELYLERPENHFTINGVKINVAADAKHTFTTGKDGGATIVLLNTVSDAISITEQDSGWFTTGLTFNGIKPAAGSSLKFGEWNDFDLPDQCYVNIDFV